MENLGEKEKDFLMGCLILMGEKAKQWEKNLLILISFSSDHDCLDISLICLICWKNKITVYYYQHGSDIETIARISS